MFHSSIHGVRNDAEYLKNGRQRAHPGIPSKKAARRAVAGDPRVLEYDSNCSKGSDS